MTERRRYRCAVYTRKSTEDGLEQEFNSLDAQREACSAYILSQASEGWEQVDEIYSDGGFSGGTMERPALERLLDDLKSHRIDIIVVYKVDRLTRSLADFARLVELMDAHSASFVSVTQSFNTTTSMGRLTLNVLLSFAQFEREVTSERIRDKIAASKRKGMWMGGNVPAGYMVEGRKLLVEPEQVKLVRRMFDRYLELQSVPLLKQELDRAGITSPQRVSRSGKRLGGKSFTTGALYHLLSNPIYAGKVRHQGKLFKGEHKAIIPPDVFDRVQAQLQANRRARHRREGIAAPSLLAGYLIDGLGRPMSPSRTARRGKSYRYYVSREAEGADTKGHKWRAPASELEEIVIAQLSRYLRSAEHLSETSTRATPDELANEMASRASDTTKLASTDPQVVLGVLERWIDQVQLGQERIAIRLQDRCMDGHSNTSQRNESTELIVEASIVRSGRRTRIAIPPSNPANARLADQSLIKLVAKAWRARAAIETSPAHFSQIAQREGHDPDYFGRLVRLGYLAPDIFIAILEGNQPATLTRQKLARMGNIPLSWAEQREMLGLTPKT